MKIKLNNGIEMPILGLGVFKATEEGEVEKAISSALSLGYRLIDTATAYGNEAGVGKAIKENNIAREEIFVTTKVWNDAQRNDDVMGAFESSLEALGMDYVDLYLIHWPVKECFNNTWKVLERIYASGRAKAIGVCNFLPHHLDSLLETADIVPAVNQFESHPLLDQTEVIKYCKEKGIIPQAHTPLMRGDLKDINLFKEIGAKYGKTPAQVVLRWNIQNGLSVIPKSVTPSRIKENTEIFDFELTSDDMTQISSLACDKRYCSHPDKFTF